MILLCFFYKPSTVPARKTVFHPVFARQAGDMTGTAAQKNWFSLCSLYMSEEGRAYCTPCTYARAGIRVIIKSRES